MELRLAFCYALVCGIARSSTQSTEDIIDSTIGWMGESLPLNSSIEGPAPLIAPGLIKQHFIPENLKKLLVDEHNFARSIVKPAATNMKKMTWDNDLQNVAQRYSTNCLFSHNQNARHSRFSVGENIYITTSPNVDDKFMTEAVTLWDEEKSDYTYATQKCVPGRMCGHYTQVVWADSFRLGCGVSRCSNVDVRGNNWKLATVLICNYGPAGNYRSRFPFKEGRSCSDCHNTDTCVNNLCTNPARDSLAPPSPCWTKWGAWSQCSATCGTGRRSRTRFCNTFVPNDCWGSDTESEWYCTRNICNKPSARWEDWGTWTECSKPCGGGERSRSRKCEVGRCSGAPGITERCNTHSCSVTKPQQCSGCGDLQISRPLIYLILSFMLCNFLFS